MAVNTNEDKNDAWDKGHSLGPVISALQALYNNQTLGKGSGSKDKTHPANPKE